MDFDGLATILGALAGGAGGQVGKQAYDSLVALVKRHRRDHAQPQEAGSDLGSDTVPEQALVHLQHHPTDETLLSQIVDALRKHSEAAPALGRDLQDWYETTKEDLRIKNYNRNTNEIQGGVFFGSVTQAYSIDTSTPAPHEKNS